MTFLYQIAAVAGAYLLGGILTGYYLVKFRTAEDIRLTGSGSAGARNVSRQLGTSGFALTLAGDALKGALAVAVARWLDSGPVATQMVLLAVVAGHIWPLHLGFRGGKGIAPALGGLFVLDPILALLAVLGAACLLMITRRATLSGLLAIALLPLGAYCLERPPSEIIGIALLAILVLFAHRSNIAEIMK